MDKKELSQLRADAVNRSRWAASGPWRYLLNDVATAAAQSAADEWQFAEYADSGFEVIDELVYALNPGWWGDSQDFSRLAFWTHQDFQQMIAKESKTPLIVKQGVEQAIANYVRLPYRTDVLDRLLLDLAMAQEITAFAVEMRRIGADKGYPVGRWLVSLVVQLSVGLGVAIGITWIFSAEWLFILAMVVAGITLLSATWSLVAFPLAYPRFQRAKKGLDRIMGKMRDAYVAMEGTMTSIKLVNERVKDADAAGVGWMAPMYVLIEDIGGRRAYV